MTVDALQQAMSSGRLTSRRITELYLARIEAIDRSGPTLRSVIEINPDALDHRRRARPRAQGKGPRGPLHGIPVLSRTTSTPPTA